MNIVLFEPEIPQNTGNIGRTCVATGSTLHLIGPMGFSMDDKSIKRAGLDYWNDLDVYYYKSFEEFISKNRNINLYMATTKSRKDYSEINYSPNDYIMFGRESAGIPEEILLEYKNTAIRIPMKDEYRSLNLANSVAIILYEALRQNRFSGLKMAGDLHKYSWDTKKY